MILHRSCIAKPIFYPRSPCGERHDYVRYYIHAREFSIHALLAESDEMHTLKLANTMFFLSTLSLRRATSQQPRGTTRTTFFYPRSPCGERRNPKMSLFCHCCFLSTLSLRRATDKDHYVDNRTGVFYPRSPCGERQEKFS